MPSSLKDLNKKRKKEYYKDHQEEDFLTAMNRLLQEREVANYGDYEIEYPFIFVFGLPRSGTTLLGQLIAYSFDIGYIDNLAARFWLAPVHGIHLSKSVLGNEKKVAFESDYARTSNVADLHEFGYFWRHWLKKETADDHIHCQEREGEIDWEGLKTTLSNIQREFDKALIFKNMFGAYHLKTLSRVLEKALWVYIKRDPLDVAISILEARKKHYDDLNTWWSNIPLEYNELKDLDYYQQIAGQVVYLGRFYDRETQQLSKLFNNVVEVNYREMCFGPAAILNRIEEACYRNWQFELKRAANPPVSFPFRTYNDRQAEKGKFNLLLKKF